MIGEIKRFNTIGFDEHSAIGRLFMDAQELPLSGYLAGKQRGGYYVCKLEDAWAATFKVKHAIACNSATSGLMAAAFAVGLKPGDQFICPAMTMSATVAAPMFTGATPLFCDVEDETFGMDWMSEPCRAIVITNLFGHPANLRSWEKVAEEQGAALIVDNAQSPFAMHRGHPASIFGDIQVCSLNVHKPIQCGEGGVITTHNDEFARRLRSFINHGETMGSTIGLNLRMPEVCAAIALVQLRRGPEIIAGRVAQAQAILAAIGDIPGLRPPVVREGCTHVYYTIPFLIEDNRAAFCAALREAGVPIVEGYVPPLYRLPAFAPFARSCPVAENLHDRRLFYFENTAYDPTPEQIEQIGDAFRRAAERVL